MFKDIVVEIDEGLKYFKYLANWQPTFLPFVASSQSSLKFAEKKNQILGNDVSERFFKSNTWYFWVDDF